jgi:hypothetical protein
MPEVISWFILQIQAYAFLLSAFRSHIAKWIALCHKQSCVIIDIANYFGKYTRKYSFDDVCNYVLSYKLKFALKPKKYTY